MHSYLIHNNYYCKPIISPSHVVLVLQCQIKPLVYLLRTIISLWDLTFSFFWNEQTYSKSLCSRFEGFLRYFLSVQTQTKMQSGQRDLSRYRWWETSLIMRCEGYAGRIFSLVKRGNLLFFCYYYLIGDVGARLIIVFDEESDNFKQGRNQFIFWLFWIQGFIEVFSSVNDYSL